MFRKKPEKKDFEFVDWLNVNRVKRESGEI